MGRLQKLNAQTIQLAIDGDECALLDMLNHYQYNIDKIIDYFLNKYELSDSLKEDLEQTARLSIIEFVYKCNAQHKDSHYFTTNYFLNIVRAVKTEIFCNRDVHISSHVANTKLTYDEDQLILDTNSEYLDDRCKVCYLRQDIEPSYDIFKYVELAHEYQIISDKEYQYINCKFKDNLTYRQLEEKFHVKYQSIQQSINMALRKIYHLCSHIYGLKKY